MKHRLIISTTLAAIGICHMTWAQTFHCDPTYQDKAFSQATIWSDMTGFGPVECDYKNPGDQTLTVYSIPKENQYYKVTGQWRSTMPGFQWCSVADGNTYESCRFALRET